MARHLLLVRVVLGSLRFADDVPYCHPTHDGDGPISPVYDDHPSPHQHGLLHPWPGIWKVSLLGLFGWMLRDHHGVLECPLPLQYALGGGEAQGPDSALARGHQ